MRLNTAKSIETANSVHARYGSWKAAKDSAQFKDGKFILNRTTPTEAPSK